MRTIEYNFEESCLWYGSKKHANKFVPSLKQRAVDYTKNLKIGPNYFHNNCYQDWPKGTKWTIGPIQVNFINTGPAANDYEVLCHSTTTAVVTRRILVEIP